MPAASASVIVPAKKVYGRIRVPGDKSIAHRYALIAALAEGTSRLTNYAPGADCRSTLACLTGLGVEIHYESGDAVTLIGRGFDHWRSPSGPLDAGNSGTTMRMLTGLLAGQSFSTTIVGDNSLSRRPMRRIIEPLTRMGAQIESTEGHAPLAIRGTRLRGISYALSVPSAQVKSAVLLAGLHAEGMTSVTEPTQTRDHTERALTTFGYSLKRSGLTTSVDADQVGHAQSVTIPGDFSSAAYWMVAAAALPGSRVEIEDVGLNPTRIGLVDVLRRFGAAVTITETANDGDEPRGTIAVAADRRGSVRIEPHEVPGIIDELPAIAALAAHGGDVTVHGAAELRVKESDRISALVSGLRALGIHADEYPDGFTVRGSEAPAGGIADAQGDHRLAMAFAIAALGAQQPSRIDGSDAVAISYPSFFNTLQRLVV